MSEYSERHSVARLVGAPPGYVGYEEGGQLTEAVRRRPYCVILLDEVEKAHQEVFDILLQVLDDGRLTDGQGRTVDFRNTILILTSNLGSQFIADPALDEAAKKDAVMNVVRTTFKPEFLNRLDDVILFDALSTEELAEIVDLQVARLVRRLADRRLTLEVTPAAREWLAVTGFDPVYGARPLRRLIQSAIGDKLARGLLAGEITDGDTVLVDLDEADRRPVGAPGTSGCCHGSRLIEQRVVTVLGKPQVIADAVAKAQQQPQFGLGVVCDVRRAGAGPGCAAPSLPRRRARHSSTPAVAQSSAPDRSDRSTSSSATRSHIRGSRRPSALSLSSSDCASAGLSSRNSARASGTRGSTKTGPPSAIASRKPLAAAAGSSAISHCSPARRKASERGIESV